MTNTMNPNTVVELRDAAIYHANDAFREASFKGHKGVQNLILSDVNLSVYPGEGLSDRPGPDRARVRF